MEICLAASHILETMLPDIKPESTKKYRPSIYNQIHSQQEDTYIYNVLTRRLAKVTPQELQLLQGNAVSGDLPAAASLIAKRYLVACGTDELTHYLQLHSTQELYLTPMDRGKETYRILPTTGCNARCFYCFEQGAQIKNMDEGTADAVIEYILKTRNPEKTIELVWFGGEPLLRTAMIDRICTALTAADIDFYSTMTTNGSLFTSQLVEKAKKDWRLKKVQITLDGVGEEHDRRKAYISLDDAYGVTLERIATLVAAGVGVTVRMNMDLQNAENIHKLYDHLRTCYSPEDRIAFDPALLFEELLSGERTRAAQQQSVLRESWLRLRQRIYDDGLIRFMPLSKGLPRWRCMANSPTAVTILPDGKLTVCDPGCESMCYGDVWQGVIDPELRKKWRNCADIREKCRSCPYLPECTGFALCPYEASDCRVVAEDNFRMRLACTIQKFEER